MLGRGLESLIPHRNHDEDKPSVSNGDFVDGKSLSDDDNNNNNERGDENFIDKLNINGDNFFNNNSSDDLLDDNKCNNEKNNSDNTDVMKNDYINNKKYQDVLSPVFRIEVESIIPNPYQPRKIFNDDALQELSASIRELGILQPLVVAKVENESEFGTSVKYQLIAGHRRLMAAKILGMSSVPVIIRKPKRNTEMLEMAVVENIQRANLNAIETARAFARLSDEFGLTQREISVRLGKSRESVANALRLLGLPSIVQDAISDGKITESHARILMQIEDPKVQKSLFSRIISEQLSVRALKKLTQKKNNSNDYISSVDNLNNSQNIQMKQIEKTLSDFLGAPVKVDFSDRGGKIVIHFFSPEEIRGIVKLINPEDKF